MGDLHSEFMERLGQSMARFGAIEVPPKITHELRPRFLNFVASESLTCSFPAQPRFANPMGMLQGGIISATFDYVFGTLAFLATQRPCASVTMNANFIRPLPADEQDFVVEVRVCALTRSTVFLEGTASGEDGKTISTASTTMSILKADT